MTKATMSTGRWRLEVSPRSPRTKKETDVVRLLFSNLLRIDVSAVGCRVGTSETRKKQKVPKKAVLTVEYIATVVGELTYVVLRLVVQSLCNAPTRTAVADQSSVSGAAEDALNAFLRKNAETVLPHNTELLQTARGCAGKEDSCVPTATSYTVADYLHEVSPPFLVRQDFDAKLLKYPFADVRVKVLQKNSPPDAVRAIEIEERSLYDALLKMESVPSNEQCKTVDAFLEEASVVLPEPLRQLPLHALYKVCRGVYRARGAPAIDVFLGNRNVQTVLKTYMAVVEVEGNERTFLRSSVLEKAMCIREYAVQVYLWNRICAKGAVEEKAWFAMPLPMPHLERIRYDRVARRVALIDSLVSSPDKRMAALGSLFSELGSESMLNQDIDDVHNLYLSHREVLSFTSLQPIGYTNVTYNLTIDRDADKDGLRQKSARWLQQHMHRVQVQVGRALCFLLSVGILHGDLSPRNIAVFTHESLQCAEFRIGIVDFGKASFLEDGKTKDYLLNLASTQLSVFVREALSKKELPDQTSFGNGIFPYEAQYSELCDKTLFDVLRSCCGSLL